MTTKLSKSFLFENMLSTLFYLRIKIFIVLLSLSIPKFVLASKIDLIVWQSTATSPRIVLPKLKSQTSLQAIKEYLETVSQNQDLIKIPGLENLSNEVYSIKKLADYDMNTQPSLLFLANTFDDMSPTGSRIQRNINTFSKAGAFPYVLGISADINLDLIQTIEFQDLIATNFNLLVALGGDDIAEELSGRTRRENSKTIFRRDISELGIIKKFKEWGLGLFFGICRGHQMGAIADGHIVIDDLTRSGKGQTHDHINKSGQSPATQQTWHHLYIEKKSLLSRLMGFKGTTSSLVIEVNSIHHQVVNPNLEGLSSAVAYHETSGVEALEMENGKGISVQFHPEFPPEISGNPKFSDFGFRFIKNIVAYSRLLRTQTKNINSCRLVLSQ